MSSSRREGASAYLGTAKWTGGLAGPGMRTQLPLTQETHDVKSASQFRQAMTWNQEGQTMGKKKLSPSQGTVRGKGSSGGNGDYDVMRRPYLRENERQGRVAPPVLWRTVTKGGPRGPFRPRPPTGYSATHQVLGQRKEESFYQRLKTDKERARSFPKKPKNHPKGQGPRRNSRRKTPRKREVSEFVLVRGLTCTDAREKPNSKILTIKVLLGIGVLGDNAGGRSSRL